jgi:hypothetical protein
MTSEIDEDAALALADRHISEGEERVRHLTMTRNSLSASGRDTDEIDRLLMLLQDTLAVWHVHRHNILSVLERESRPEFNAAHEQVNALQTKDARCSPLDTVVAEMDRAENEGNQARD